MNSERHISTSTAAVLIIVAVVVILAVGWYFMNRRASVKAPTGPQVQQGAEGKMGKGGAIAPTTP